MRKLAIAMALASTVLATPAVARDKSWYAGVEGGAMLVEDAKLDYQDANMSINDAIVLDYKTGIDLDLIGGYDFGGFRLEAELGYKRASIDEALIDGRLLNTANVIVPVDGKVRVLSAMVNGMLDFGDDDGWNGYVGAGVGVARVKHTIGTTTSLGSSSDSDSGLAWQVIAGVRKAISANVDLGLKYRFFNAKYDYGDSTDGGLSGRFRSHSLLASLIFNYGAAEVAVPPPPLPPVPPPPPPPPGKGECV